MKSVFRKHLSKKKEEPLQKPEKNILTVRMARKCEIGAAPRETYHTGCALISGKIAQSFLAACAQQNRRQRAHHRIPARLAGGRETRAASSAGTGNYLARGDTTKPRRSFARRNAACAAKISKARRLRFLHALPRRVRAHFIALPSANQLRNITRIARA